MTDPEYTKRWTCEFCGKRYVVEGLARDCEDRHLEQTTQKNDRIAS